MSALHPNQGGDLFPAGNVRNCRGTYSQFQVIRMGFHQLVDQLERFTDPDPFVGVVASVQWRLEFAKTITERSVEKPSSTIACWMVSIVRGME